MRLRKLFAPLLLAVTGNVCATPERALVAFDAYCFGFDGKVDRLEKMVEAVGGEPLSPGIMNADPVVAREGGKSFKVSYQGLAFVVVATLPSACSVLFPRQVTPKIQYLLENNYSLSQPSIDSEGPRITKLYRILNPSTHEGGYVSYISAKPGFGADEAVVLGFVPKEVSDWTVLSRGFGVAPKTTNPGDIIQLGAGDSIYTNDVLGWEFTIPPGWQRRSPEEIEVQRKKRRAMIESQINAELPRVKTDVLYLKNDRVSLNRFTSDLSAYDLSGFNSYLDLQNDKFSMIKKAIESRGAKVESTRGSTIIDAIPFETLTLSLSPPGSDIEALRIKIFDGIVKGKSFAMGYIVSSLEERDLIERSIMRSRFK